MRIERNPDMERYLDLMQMSWDELGFSYKMRPDFARYKRLIAQELYVFWGALIDGRPVGYIGIMKASSLFNPSKKQSILDSFFVLPEYRGGVVSARLFGVAGMESIGRTMMCGCPRDGALAKTLLKRGWVEAEAVYTKEL